jgi:hypothetical protein
MARDQIQQGVDVAREKQKASLERAGAKSFRQLTIDYMEKKFPDFAPNTIKQRRHHIDDILIRKLGDLAARDVTTSMQDDSLEPGTAFQSSATMQSRKATLKALSMRAGPMGGPQG